MKNPRILFILKRRDGYGEYGASGFSSGLANSVHFLVSMLTRAGITAAEAEVNDNNDIDREVARFKPTHVIVEALWVVPEKFAELSRLHPSVQWIVRLHSEIPFLANEGVAMDWIIRYTQMNHVKVAVNSPRALRDIQEVLIANGLCYCAENSVVYLPNWYPVADFKPRKKPDDGEVHIGCFGAIRPFKNQLIQAIAAMKFAENIGKTLFFHVNFTRQEQGGSNNFKNMEALFRRTKHHLVESEWLSHSEFVDLLEDIDIGMQVSFTETFSIVAADMANARVPLVVSDEIPWASVWSSADPTDSQSIVTALGRVTHWPFRKVAIKGNLAGLKRYSKISQITWLSYFRNPKV